MSITVRQDSKVGTHLSSLFWKSYDTRPSPHHAQLSLGTRDHNCYSGGELVVQRVTSKMSLLSSKSQVPHHSSDQGERGKFSILGIICSILFILLAIRLILKLLDGSERSDARKGLPRAVLTSWRIVNHLIFSNNRCALSIFLMPRDPGINHPVSILMPKKRSPILSSYQQPFPR